MNEEDFFMKNNKNINQKYRYRLTYQKIPQILPDAIQPFFIRDFLGYIRNKNYIIINSKITVQPKINVIL